MTQEESKEKSKLIFESENLNDGILVAPALMQELIEQIHSDHKLELEAEYKRGWNDRHTQSDLEGRTCESCINKEDHGFGCVEWEQK